MSGLQAALGIVSLALMGLAACGGSASGPSQGAIALNNRGVGLMGYFDYPAAREVFAEVVAAEPQWLEAKVNLAIATLNRQREGDEALADALLQEVLAANPQHLRAHFVAGLLRLYEGADAPALAHFQQVAEADPQDAYAAYYTGQLLAGDDPESALTWFERALDGDPYLRSAYYGASIALRRLGRRDEALAMQQRYLQLESNPRARLAEFKYTRMGPKADTLAMPALAVPSDAALPEGLLFAPPRRVEGVAALGEDASLTTADVNGDGVLDLYASAVEGGGTLLLLGRGEGRFEAAPGHLLSGIDGVVGAAWADFDNDGDVDVYLCRARLDVLWWQGDGDGWEDRAATLETPLPDDACRDVAAFDADHDGDVDVFVVSQGANELLNNDGDGSFRALASDQGLTGAGGGRQVLAFDVDADRDVDIAVLHDAPPHELYLNDRLWQYEPLEASAFVDANTLAMTVGDADADGLGELYLLSGDDATLEVLRWDGTTLRTASLDGPKVGGARALDLGDFDGDGRLELLVAGASGVQRFDAPRLIEGAAASLPSVLGEATTTMLPVLATPATGPALAVVGADRRLRWLAPGPARHPFVALALRGRESVADAMRSNAAGIGTRIALRRGEFWSTASTFDSHSAPGQSLQPVSIGLGGVDAAQFVAIDWSDGVYQTELDLAAGRLHTISETQRQLASCPVLFAWNGESYGFVTDLLGVGGIGFFLAPGQYGQPRPWERLLLDESQLQARDGEWVLKFTEPMEEVAYVDQLALEQVLVPPGWDVLLDERHSTDPTRPPTGALHWFREVLSPVAATAADGTDATASVRERDGRAAPVGARDGRFLGRLRQPQSLTLEFPPRLGSGDGQARWLLADGWVEYPYSQTLFAAWQADVTYEAPSLQASVDGVEWQTLAAAFGYPAGMPRQMALRLDGLPSGTRYLRLTGNLEIYWDRLRVVLEAPAPDGARVLAAPLRTARLAQVGFPERITHDQRRPEFVYASRQAYWDTRYMRGAYTAFGDVLPLVEATDDALALVGAGEELHVAFEAVTPSLDPGWTRRYVLTTTGWAKDMDLYTRSGDTVAPLPHRSQDPQVLARRDALHARYHVRPLSGK